MVEEILARYQHLLKQIRMSYCSSRRFLCAILQSFALNYDKWISGFVFGAVSSDLALYTAMLSMITFLTYALGCSCRCCCVAFLHKNVFLLHHCQIVTGFLSIRFAAARRRTRNDIYEKIMLHNAKLVSSRLFFCITFQSTPDRSSWLQLFALAALCLFDFNLMMHPLTELCIIGNHGEWFLFMTLLSRDFLIKLRLLIFPESTLWITII